MYDVETMTWNERGGDEFVYAGLKLIQDKMKAVYVPESSTVDKLIFRREDGTEFEYRDLEEAVEDVFVLPMETEEWLAFRYKYNNISDATYDELIYQFRESQKQDGPDPDDWHDQQVQDAMMGL